MSTRLRRLYLGITQGSSVAVNGASPWGFQDLPPSHGSPCTGALRFEKILDEYPAYVAILGPSKCCHPMLPSLMLDRLEILEGLYRGCRLAVGPLLSK